MLRKIILIISFCLLVTTISRASDYIPYPVVFVHGIGSNAGTWNITNNKLRNYFLNRFGLTYEEQFFRFVDYSDDNKANGDITDKPVKKLIYQIDAPITPDDPYGGVITLLKNRFGTNAPDKVILVCHSMGGMVARSLLKQDESGIGGKPANYYRNHIDKIIFIGTPHKGSPLASALWLVRQEKENLGQKIQAVSNEIGIGGDPFDPEIQALKDLKDNLYATLQTTKEVFEWAKNPVTPVIGKQLDFSIDSEGSAIEQLRVADDVKSTLTVWGESSVKDEYGVRATTVTYIREEYNHSDSDVFLEPQKGNLSQLTDNQNYVLYGQHSSEFLFPEIGLGVDLARLATLELIPNFVSDTGDDLQGKTLKSIPGMLVATRSFDFYNPGTTLKDIGNSLDALKGGAGDGVVTTDSQRGIGKVKEGTDNSGFCVINGISVMKDNRYPESTTLTKQDGKGLDYEYRLGDGIFNLSNCTYYIYATDKAGNIRLSTFIIDTTEPEVLITSPNNNLITTRYVTIGGTASDNNKLFKVDVYLTNLDTNTESEYISRRLNGTASNWSIGRSSVTNGNWRIKAVVYDDAGNTTEIAKSFAVNIDTTTNTDDNDGEGNNDPRIRDRDGDGLSDYQEKELGTDPNNFDTDGGGLNDGAEIAQGKDPLNPADDNEAPFIQITSPANGDVFNTTTITVEGNANTHTNIEILEVEINGQDCDITPATAVEFSNTIEVSEGNNKEIKATYTDQTGNHKSARVYIIVDQTPPIVNIYPNYKAGTKVTGKTHYTLNYKSCQYEKVYKRDIWNPITFGGDWIDTTSGIDSAGVNFITTLNGLEYVNEERAKGCDKQPQEGEHMIMATITDKAGNTSEPKTSNFTVIWKEELVDVGGPSCDTPDDNESISKPDLIALVPTNNNRPIGMIANGVAPFTESLITNITQDPVDYIFTNELDLIEIERYRLIVIPSGGLMGLSNSQDFKQKLQDYVNSGGTILCFTQQYGYDFSALPVQYTGYSIQDTGQTLSAFGWNEDQSCQSNSTYINEISPIFNGQGKVNLDFNVDGYFVSYPTTTKVLLNRTKNNMPCLIEYDISAMAGLPDGGIVQGGKVIVTTLYSDFSYAQGSLSSEERTLIHSLITYLKDPSTPATQSP